MSEPVSRCALMVLPDPASPTRSAGAARPRRSRTRAVTGAGAVHGLPPKSIAGSRSTSASPTRAFATLTSCFHVPAWSRCSLARNCDPRAPRRVDRAQPGTSPRRIGRDAGELVNVPPEGAACERISSTGRSELLHVDAGGRFGDDRRRAGPAELQAPWHGALDRASRHLYSYARRSADPDRWTVQVLCRTPRTALPNQASPSAGHGLAAVGLRGTRRASDSLATRFRHHRGPRIGTPAARRSRERRCRSAFVRPIGPDCSRGAGRRTLPAARGCAACVGSELPEQPHEPHHRQLDQADQQANQREELSVLKIDATGSKIDATGVCHVATSGPSPDVRARGGCSGWNPGRIRNEALNAKQAGRTETVLTIGELTESGSGQSHPSRRQEHTPDRSRR